MVTVLVVYADGNVDGRRTVGSASNAYVYDGASVVYVSRIKVDGADVAS